MTHRCIVNVAVDRWFPRGAARLMGSLSQHSPNRQEEMCWTKNFPEGSPTHAEAPYAFKTYAVEAAKAAGYTSILWLDASMWAVRDLEPLWQEIETHGSCFFRTGFALGHYATDAALSQLGRSRDDSMTTSLCAGGIYGLDLTHEASRAFQAGMLDFAEDRKIFQGAWDNKSQQCSIDPRCLGHRHDMVPMAHLVEELGLHIVNPPRFWALPTEEWPEPMGHPDALILARGM